MNFQKIITNPKFHLIFLAILLLVIFSFWQPQESNDGGVYEDFAEKIVNEGKVDLSMPGFHGSDWLVAGVYLITHSRFSVYYVDILAAFLLVPLIYLLVKEIYGQELLAVIAAYIYILMPFEVFNALRGGHQTVHFFWSLLALYLLFKNKRWGWLVYGISLITRPFSIALAPFYLYKKKFSQLLLSFILPAVYVTTQYWQTGRVIIGQHPELTVEKLFSLKRFFLNIIYGVQNYFSIHNFSPFNNLYPMDMVHLSPLITVMAVLGIFYFKKYYDDKKLFYTLIVAAAIAYLLPSSFYRIDMWYFGIFNLLLIFLALPVIEKYKRLIPLIAFTFSFQFFYFYLSYQKLFWQPYIIFLIPLVVLAVSVVYVGLTHPNSSPFQGEV